MAKLVSRPERNRRPLKVGAVVLAAGGSTRMRQPKQLMAVNGSPLILRTVTAVLAAPVWPVILVVGSAADAVRPLLARLPLQVTDNPRWELGIGTSLRLGVEMLDQFSTRLDGVLIALGDQPCLSADAIEDLLAVFDGPGSIAAARYSGIVGAPAIFGRTFFPELLALPNEAGAQRVLRSHSKIVSAVDLPELATDLDTPEDYQRFLEAQKKRKSIL